MRRILIALLTATAIVLAGAPAFADGTVANPDGSTTTTTTSTSGDEVTTVETTVYPCVRREQTTVTRTTVESPSAGSESTSSSTARCGDLRAESNIAASASVYAYGTAGSEVDFSVSGGDVTPTGQVQVILDGRVYATVNLDPQGEGSTALPQTLGAGEHVIDVSYGGDASTAPALMSAGTGPLAGALELDIPRAHSKISFTGPKTVEPSKRANVRVKVRSLESGLRPTGRVAIYVGKKRVKVVALKSSAQGDPKVRLPKIKSTGKTKIHAVYLPDRNHDGSRSTVKTLEVQR